MLTILIKLQQIILQNNLVNLYNKKDINFETNCLLKLLNNNLKIF